jgi:hypothetical protein
MYKPVDNEISDESFQKCGQYIYERDISYTYCLIEKNKLEEQNAFLVSELCLVNNEINDLKININELNLKGYLNTKNLSANTYNIIFFKNQYSINFLKNKQSMKNMKEFLKNKENERNLLLLDSETTEKQLKRVKSKIKEYH